MSSVMQSTQRPGPAPLSGKHLLAGGIVAAGLMAAGVAGAGTAAAAPDDTGAAPHSVSAPDAGNSTVKTPPSRGQVRESDKPADKPLRRVNRPSADSDEAAGEESRPQRRDRTRRAERAAAASERPSRTVTRPAATETAP